MYQGYDSHFFSVVRCIINLGENRNPEESRWIQCKYRNSCPTGIPVKNSCESKKKQEILRPLKKKVPVEHSSGKHRKKRNPQESWQERFFVPPKNPEKRNYQPSLYTKLLPKRPDILGTKDPAFGHCQTFWTTSLLLSTQRLWQLLAWFFRERTKIHTDLAGKPLAIVKNPATSLTSFP